MKLISRKNLKTMTSLSFESFGLDDSFIKLQFRIKIIFQKISYIILGLELFTSLMTYLQDKNGILFLEGATVT